MKWQLFINTKLNLEDKSLKVICDYTGVLSSNAFLSYLDENAVNYLVTDKVSEILAATGNSSVSVIITKLKTIPAFISSKFITLHFNYADIPMNGDIESILKGVNSEAIIELLNYVYDSDYHQVITRFNIESLFVQAKKHIISTEIDSLIESLNTILQTTPQIENVLNLGVLWGRLVYLSATHEDARYVSYIDQVDTFAFSFILDEGMQKASFASTEKNPKSVDKILANIKSNNKDKSALICFDCMGFAEWYLLQEFLSESGLSFKDSALFSLLPSITSISRSAIFNGSREVYDIKSPGRSNEAKAFAKFFSDKETKYFTEQDSITEDSLLGYNCISILYTFFDDLSHSAQFPPNERSKSLYFDSIRAYLKKSAVLLTLQTLLNNDFAVYFCSDHGSVIATGNCQKLDKYLVDSFAKRAIIIPLESADLIEQTKIKIPFIENRLIALPESRTMFANKNQIEINHGGVTVEEIVVPFIKVIK